MISKIFLSIIKLLINFLNKLNLDRYLHDKIIYYIGLNQILENRKKYKYIKSIHEIEYKIFSQNGEDGIIDYLLNQLKLIPHNTNFVEIGVGDYRESNTRFLYNLYYSKGLIVDSIKNMANLIKPHVNLWKGDLRSCNKTVDAQNINKILNKYCDFEIDIFSIDIDSIDYWVIQKLKKNISKIFIAEYNPTFGSKYKVTVPNISGFNRTKYHYSNLCYGMSIKALIDIMDSKNYYFVGTNLQKFNAFFISKDYSKRKYFPNLAKNYLKNTINTNIRDSRDKLYNLNFLPNIKKIKQIENCKVINLDENINKLVKIKELI
jgi:hypothetical protein